MNYIDIFNGDADGICALIQLRLASPVNSQLVTGVKRNIELLSQVSVEAGDQLTVLDISMDKNRQALLALLAKPVDILYVDHHFAGEIPQHPRLISLINTEADICTSLLVNDYLQGKYAEWAVTGAFGDNLDAAALKAAQPLHLTAPELADLQNLGVSINYNAYGESLDDLLIRPEVLYRHLADYASPLQFISEQQRLFQNLLAAYREDLQKAEGMPAEYENDKIAVFILPDQKWARRVSGVWSNELANRHPDRAHAVLSCNRRGGFQVSVRAPVNRKTGADELCRRFPEGGGRKAAAGINHLPQPHLAEFIRAFIAQYP